MSSKLTLYGDTASPPVRFVMITASLLKMNLNFHSIDLFKSENKSDFFRKINTLQKVPALKVGEDTTISDSHAIAVYLCNKSEKQDLYPSDSLLRAKVDQMLYFDATTLFPADSDIYTDYFSGIWPPKEINLQKWYKSVDYLEDQLSKHRWLVGDKMLLCDICCGLTVSSMNITVPLLEKHTRVKEWMMEMKKLSCFEIDRQGVERFMFYIKKAGPALN